MTCFSCRRKGHLVSNCKLAMNCRAVTRVSADQGDSVKPVSVSTVPKYVSLVMRGKSRLFKIDASERQSIMPRFLFDDVDLKSRDRADVSLRSRDLVLNVEVIVSDRISEPVLGMDFLAGNGCSWNIAGGTLDVAGRRILMQHLDRSDAGSWRSGLCSSSSNSSNCVIVSEMVNQSQHCAVPTSDRSEDTVVNDFLGIKEERYHNPSSSVVLEAAPVNGEACKTMRFTSVNPHRDRVESPRRLVATGLLAGREVIKCNRALLRIGKYHSPQWTRFHTEVSREL